MKRLTNFAVGDIAVTNGILSNFVAVSSIVYTATFTPSDIGETTIDVAPQGATLMPLANNTNTAASQFNWNYDSTSPTISISSSDVADGATIMMPQFL